MIKNFSYSIKNRITPRNYFVFDFCGDVRGKSILDVGCSFGWYEKMATEAKTKSIIGLEPNEKFFYQARVEVPRAKFIVGSAEKLPFKDCLFDKVIFLEVFEHLPKGVENTAIKEIFRVLKPKGELVISTPNLHVFSCLLDPVWYFGHRHYSCQHVKSSLEKNGFLIDEVFIYGGFWEMTRMITHYFFKWIFGLEDPLKTFFEKKMLPDRNNPHNFAYIYIKAKKNEK